MEEKDAKKIFGNVLDYLEPDIPKIEKELRAFGFLVEQEVEPYYSLDCFKGINYDVNHCLERCFSRATDCIITFIEEGYFIKKADKNEY